MSLDDRVEVKRSPIHGKGLFAARRFHRGGYIATFEGKQTRKNGMHVLWVLQDDGSEVGIEGRNALRYLNHSSKPNAEFVGADLHAVRTIQVGEELTIDYGPDWDDE